MSSSRDKERHITLPSFDQMMQARRAQEAERVARTEVTGMTEEELIIAREELVALETRTKDLCSKMRREALAESERIATEAQEQAEVIRRRARAEGFDEAFANTKADLDAARENMANAARELEKTGSEMFALIESRIFDIAMDVTKTILKKELERDNEAYLSIIENALEPLRDVQHLTLHMSPDGFDRIFGGVNPEIPLEEMTTRGIKVVRDPKIAMGDCVVESAMGSFGYGVEIQTERMREAVQIKKGERAT